MTIEDIIKLINSCEIETGYAYLDGDRVSQAADTILAALEKEREGEVVLVKGELDPCEIIDRGILDSVDGKRGQLIFRPTKGDK